MVEALSSPERVYRDFTLAFDSRSDDRNPNQFDIRLPDVPGFELGTRHPFVLPFEPGSAPRQLEQKIITLGTQDREARALGSALFNALFTGSTRESFLVAWSETHRNSDAGLRIRLLIDPQRPGGRVLSALPWELLYRHETREFLALSRVTPVVRQLPVPRSRRPTDVEGPLRIAVVVSSPRDHQPLALARERERIEEICRHDPDVEVTVLDSATPDALRRALRNDRFHVFHFMGHGTVESEGGVGRLIFEDETGQGVSVSGEVLAVMFQDCPELHCVVLNACDSGSLPRHEGQDPYSVVATAMVMAGLPSVVAMQLPISDGAALAFSESFYEALAESSRIEEAVTEGRLAIHRRFEGSLEWATPALYLGADDDVSHPRDEPAERTTNPDSSCKYSNQINHSKGVLIGDEIQLGSMTFGND